MEKLVFVFLFISSAAFSLQLEFLAETELPKKPKFEKTTVGGLSGIYYNSKTGKTVAVSDDRGKINEPRFYDLNLELKPKKFSVEVKAVHFVKDTNKKTPFKVMDMEGITFLTEDLWLVSAEGDNNHKPRIPPALFVVKSDGSWVQNFDLPDKCIPESTGLQKKGINNNRGPEGLSVSPSGKKFLVGIESPLVQEAGAGRLARLLEYSIFSTQQVKLWNEYLYPVGDNVDKPGLPLDNGISEVLYLDETRVLVLERGVRLSDKNIVLDSKIFLVDLKTADKEKPLKKTLVLDLDQLKSKLKNQGGQNGSLENYEGMTWGPLLDGKKTLILVSDDNFMRKQRTHFLAFQLKEP